MARQVGAGLWTWLPAGWRSHRRVEQIIREELEAIGCWEMLMPVLQPAEIWKRSGRYDIDEVFKLQDRRGAELVLALSHEENLTFHMAREVRSYRDLPKLLYHFQTKERDEARPRAGVLRTREFIMKDAYSFDRDREGLDRSYELFVGAYDRVFDRAGLEWYRVESDVGAMGGFGAHEYMAPCPAGENDVALSSGGYAANVEVASATPQPVDGLPEGLDAPERVETPGAATVEEVAGQLGVPAGAIIKAFPVFVEDRGPVLVVIRGDHRLNEIKLQNALGAACAGRRARGGPERVRRRAGLHRPRGGAGGGGGRPGARGPPRPGGGRQRAGPAPARRRAGARLRRPPGWTCARSRRATPPRTASKITHRARDRDREHLQARPALLRAAGRQATSTRRARSSSCGWAPTASARRAWWPPRSSRAPTSRASPGRAPSRPSTSSS